MEQAKVFGWNREGLDELHLHRDSGPSRNREETTLYDTKKIRFEERIFKSEKSSPR